MKVGLCVAEALQVRLGPYGGSRCGSRPPSSTLGEAPGSQAVVAAASAAAAVGAAAAIGASTLHARTHNTKLGILDNS